MDGTLGLCCIRAGSPEGAQQRALQLLDYPHVVWHRHPAARVLVLAGHSSLLAQKNRMELFSFALLRVLVPVIRQSPPPAEDSKQGIRKGLLCVRVSWQLPSEQPWMGNEGREQGNAEEGTARALPRALPAWALLPACPALHRTSCVSHIMAFPRVWSPGCLCLFFFEGLLPCGRFSKLFCREELIFHNK